MSTIRVDLHHSTGPVKAMNAVCNGPLQKGGRYDFTDEFREMGVPFARLHDAEYPYGGNQYVDIHCVFPDPDADPTLPQSYNFTCTDKYLLGIIGAGAEVFYRLGESIDYNERQLYVHPPKDPHKWAVVCEHIVRHYNEGWADGFRMNIRYWEIWNEPDNYAMWSGTPEQFFALYRVTACHLRSCFPHLRIGGYSASGLYALNRKDPSPWFRSLIPFMERFFAYITAPETKAPLDFFSWHCYAESPEEVALHAGYVREMLDRNGLTDAESILSEYNNYDSLGERPSLRPAYPAELAATFVMGQNAPLDMMMYYDMRITTFMNGILHPTLRAYGYERAPAFYTYAMFAALRRLGTAVSAVSDEPHLYALAAADGKGKAGLFLSAYGYSGKVTLKIPGASFARIRVHALSEGKYRLALASDYWDDYTLSVSDNTVYYIELI